MTPEVKDHNTPPIDILIIGGTTEGRTAVSTCEEAQKPYFYSTKSDSQEIDCLHGQHISGGFDAEAMIHFCKEYKIKLIIDAAHPFAMNVHTNIGIAAEACSIPIVRIERHFPEHNDAFVWCDSYEEAIDHLKTSGIKRLLALTGVNTIQKLKDYWTSSDNDVYFRIMNRKESLEEVDRAKFPHERLIFYDDHQDDRLLFSQISPQAIITKESGETGGFTTKTEIALEMGIPVLVIRRPPLPYTPHSIVYGRYGLRRSVESLLPHFYDLKIGYTTGSCATAATAAAFTTLLTGEILDECTITLPNDEPISIPIHTTTRISSSVTSTVKKYSGDDPDVTNGTEICATVELDPTHSDIVFGQGVGVGVVTLPGLGLEVGGPAINTTPRMMMTREIQRLCHLYHVDPDTGINITISVPRGEELAKKTFNPKIGIIGGISIIGTSGIVKPFSSEAFVNSIKTEIRVAKSLGVDRLVINSGAKSEKYIKDLYPSLPSQAFVHYGNFIGETISAAVDIGFRHISMGVMIGKAVKLAEGSLDTHSKKVVMNKDFLLHLAHSCGCTPAQTSAIENMTLARELWDIIPVNTSEFYSHLIQKCHDTCLPLLRDCSLTIYLITESGEIVGTSV